MTNNGTVYNSEAENEALATLDRINSTPAQRTNARIILGMSYSLAMALEALEDIEETKTLKEWEEWQKKQGGFWTVLYDDYWQGWLFVSDKEDTENDR